MDNLSLCSDSLHEEPSTDEEIETNSGDAQDAKKDHKWLSLHWSRDSKNVFFWMLAVLGMIAVTAAIVLTFTFSFLSNEETNEFENGFQQQASVIAEATRFHAKTVVGSLESMSDTITSYTGATTADWPFVTVPDFDRRGERARVEAYIETLAFSPLVTYEDRQRWSIFTAYDSDWLGPIATEVPSEIYRLDSDSGDSVVDDNILMIPVWMTSPRPHNASLVNFNLISDSTYYYLFNAMTESKHTALSAVYTNANMYEKLFAPGQHDKVHDTLTHEHFVGEDTSASEHQAHETGTASVETGPKAEAIPHSVLMAPVYDSFDSQTRSLAGIIHGNLPWDAYLTELLPPGVNGIIAVLKNSCGQSFSFRIDGPKAIYIGEGDLHDSKYQDMAEEVDFGADFLGEETRTYRQCFYSLVIYPSEEFEKSFESNDTEKFTALLAIVFCCLALFFFIFVWFVQRRQQKVMGIATRTTAIISNLFPDNVRERIMEQAEAQANRELDGGEGAEASSNLKNILKDSTPSATYKTRNSLVSSNGGSHMPSGVRILEDAPIADLYPYCTVLFADIVGFTAWSSTRDPAQVFVLLETLYGAFDAIAKRRRIFKVETIGDCYVAVAGLPQPRKDHALGMARFAHDCLVKSGEVFHCLEISLGPGTSGLNMRLGLHSGPVTAGVLRGEKGRFQLFGDTVNTAARMESNSQTGKIHCSKDTADLIKAGGKAQWVSERSDKIVAKGKGEMTTYWVTVRSSDGATQSTGESSQCSNEDALASIYNMHPDALPLSTRNSCQKKLSKQHARLVDWNVELLASLLRNVAANRETGRKSILHSSGMSEPRLDQAPGQMPFSEWSQSIDLPEVSKKGGTTNKNVELSADVISQLRHFVTAIALLHGDNCFHNFDHASHVTMSVHKLLLRVIQSGEESFGIASDHLTHFGAVMSALIHDVDHRGVPNNRLIEEDPELAHKYDEKSVAEQHAIDLAWNLLMSEHYGDLRRTIYTSGSELKRFRTVLVNSVLSTDIVNKDLKELRNERWAIAFSEEDQQEMARCDADRYRASSVLEHLIQASDVSHTMQHWHVYRSWNERLFEEMYRAYKDGRAEKDPSLSWYRGELGFFDFYIIPLAKKLAEVGVFGVSSSEYLDFALKNRAEWERKGNEVVEGMLLKVNGCGDNVAATIDMVVEC